MEREWEKERLVFMHSSFFLTDIIGVYVCLPFYHFPKAWRKNMRSAYSAFWENDVVCDNPVSKFHESCMRMIAPSCKQNEITFPENITME